MIRTTAVCQASDETEVVVERDVILDNPTLTLEVRSGEPMSHIPPRPQGRPFPGKEAENWGPASAKWNSQEIFLRPISSLLKGEINRHMALWLLGSLSRRTGVTS